MKTQGPVETPKVSPISATPATTQLVARAFKEETTSEQSTAEAPGQTATLARPPATPPPQPPSSNPVHHPLNAGHRIQNISLGLQPKRAIEVSNESSEQESEQAEEESRQRSYDLSAISSAIGSDTTLNPHSTQFSQFSDTFIHRKPTDTNIPIGEAMGKHINVQDADLEQVAHGLVYKNGALSQSEKTWLSEKGYQNSNVINLDNGINYMFLTPLYEGPSPILAFRGTDDGATAWQDLDPNSPGYSGINKHFKDVAAQAEALAIVHGKLLVTGHSLGGALAQHFTARFPGAVKRLVTFQSAAPNAKQYADISGLEDAPEVVHHVAKGDVVDLAGGAHLKGTFFEHDMADQGFFGRPIKAHTSMLLNTGDLNQNRHHGVLADGSKVTGKHNKITKYEGYDRNPHDFKSRLVEAPRVAIGGLVNGVADAGSAAWKGTKAVGNAAWTGTKAVGNAAWNGLSWAGNKLFGKKPVVQRSPELSGTISLSSVINDQISASFASSLEQAHVSGFPRNPSIQRALEPVASQPPLNAGHHLQNISLTIQPKLTIGQPNDPYEQEADRVAAQVVQQINDPRSVDPMADQVVRRSPMPIFPVIQRQLTDDQIQHANRIRKARGLPPVANPQNNQNNQNVAIVPPQPINTPTTNTPTTNTPPIADIEAPQNQQQPINQPANPLPTINLNNGIINLEQLKTFLDSTTLEIIATIDSQSDIIRNILKHPLGQSWHTAKHELVNGDPKSELLMEKILDYRKWHHNAILEKTQEKVNRDKKDDQGLTNWPSAGSKTLTSDIDVNLKGTQTEYAVKVFNELFKQDGWDYEAGVVYDVNVYAMDFMHKFGGIDIDGHKVTKKEGGRQGQSQGGFRERSFLKLDQDQQDEWSLVKVRLYISNPVQWDEYAEAAGLSEEKKQSVEAKFKSYTKELYDEMCKEANTTLNEAEDMMMSGISGLNTQSEHLVKKKYGANIPNSEALAENLQMGASNRVYEKKLEKVALLRNELKELIARYDEMVKAGDNGGYLGQVTGREMLNGNIELKLKSLRKLISECSLFSNEAYVTDAAVYHAVVGLQGGNAIEQTKAEAMQAVTENMGDALKEISRHNDTLGEAAFKSGKYIWRMSDAAKNMGFGNIDGVQDLYEVSYSIANEIKGQKGVDEKQASEAKMGEIGITTGSQLVAKILTVGTEIRGAYTNLKKSEQISLSKPTPNVKNAINTN
jgi:pimeloyl-ACP methyl ester carboxylesterase